MIETQSSITRTRNLLSLGFMAVLVISIIMSRDVEADQLEVSASLGCCEDADDPETCYPADPANMMTCEMEHEPALCTWDPMPNASAAKPVNLQCCDDSWGLVWLEQCSPHGPGKICNGTVVATR